MHVGADTAVPVRANQSTAAGARLEPAERVAGCAEQRWQSGDLSYRNEPSTTPVNDDSRNTAGLPGEDTALEALTKPGQARASVLPREGDPSRLRPKNRREGDVQSQRLRATRDLIYCRLQSRREPRVAAVADHQPDVTIEVQSEESGLDLASCELPQEV